MKNIKEFVLLFKNTRKKELNIKYVLTTILLILIYFINIEFCLQSK